MEYYYLLTNLIAIGYNAPSKPFRIRMLYGIQFNTKSHFPNNIPHINQNIATLLLCVCKIYIQAIKKIK